MVLFLHLLGGRSRKSEDVQRAQREAHVRVQGGDRYGMGVKLWIAKNPSTRGHTRILLRQGRENPRGDQWACMTIRSLPDHPSSLQITHSERL